MRLDRGKIAAAVAAERERCAKLAEAAMTKDRRTHLAEGVPALFSAEAAFDLACKTIAGDIRRSA